MLPVLGALGVSVWRQSFSPSSVRIIPPNPFGACNEDAVVLPKKSFVTSISTVFRMAVGLQPAQERADAAVRESNT